MARAEITVRILDLPEVQEALETAAEHVERLTRERDEARAESARLQREAWLEALQDEDRLTPFITAFRQAEHAAETIPADGRSVLVAYLTGLGTEGTDKT